MAIASVIFLFFAFSYMFSLATVNVIPKSQDIVLNENLSASKNGTSALPFDLVVISGDESAIVQTTEEKDVSQKAQGAVVIYNAFSTAPQRLDIDTRLEGSNGKMYKTLTKATVPGKTAKGTPGSVEVRIYATEAGADYNSAPLDFKIFGFKGTPKYEKFYARSKSDIIGGLIGKIPFISDAQNVATTAELKAGLQAKLLQKATDQIPTGFILFKDAVFLKTGDAVADFASAKDNAVPMKIKGTLYGLLFDENKLTKKIAQDMIAKYDGAPVYIQNISDLKFSLPNIDSISFSDVKDINFTLTGNSKIVWKVDEEKLVTELLGKTKSDFNTILAQYPNIVSANLTLRPLWKMSIPDKKTEVRLIVNYPI